MRKSLFACTACVLLAASAPSDALAPSSAFGTRYVERQDKVLGITRAAESKIQEMERWLWSLEPENQFETISFGLVEHMDAKTDVLRELIPPRAGKILKMNDTVLEDGSTLSEAAKMIAASKSIRLSSDQDHIWLESADQDRAMAVSEAIWPTLRQSLTQMTDRPLPRSAPDARRQIQRAPVELSTDWDLVVGKNSGVYATAHYVSRASAIARQKGLQASYQIHHRTGLQGATLFAQQIKDRNLFGQITDWMEIRSLESGKVVDATYNMEAVGRWIERLQALFENLYYLDVSAGDQAVARLAWEILEIFEEIGKDKEMHFLQPFLQVAFGDGRYEMLDDIYARSTPKPPASTTVRDLVFKYLFESDIELVLKGLRQMAASGNGTRPRHQRNDILSGQRPPNFWLGGVSSSLYQALGIKAEVTVLPGGDIRAKLDALKETKGLSDNDVVLLYCHENYDSRRGSSNPLDRMRLVAAPLSVLMERKTRYWIDSAFAYHYFGPKARAFPFIFEETIEVDAVVRHEVYGKGLFLDPALRGKGFTGELMAYQKNIYEHYFNGYDILTNVGHPATLRVFVDDFEANLVNDPEDHSIVEKEQLMTFVALGLLGQREVEWLLDQASRHGGEVLQQDLYADLRSKWAYEGRGNALTGIRKKLDDVARVKGEQAVADLLFQCGGLMVRGNVHKSPAPAHVSSIAEFLRERFPGRDAISAVDLDTGSGHFVPDFHAVLKDIFMEVDICGVETNATSYRSDHDKLRAGGFVIKNGSPEASEEGSPYQYSELGLTDSSLDIVTINNISNNARKELVLLSQAARILTPGGVLLVTIEEENIPGELTKSVVEYLQRRGFQVQVLESDEIPDDYPRSVNYKDGQLIIAWKRGSQTMQDHGGLNGVVSAGFKSSASALAPQSLLGPVDPRQRARIRRGLAVRALIDAYKKQLLTGKTDPESVAEALISEAARISSELGIAVFPVECESGVNPYWIPYTFTIDGKPLLLVAIRGTQKMLVLEGGARKDQESLAVRIAALSSSDKTTRETAFVELTRGREEQRLLLGWLTRHPKNLQKFIDARSVSIKRLAILWQKMIDYMDRLSKFAMPAGKNPAVLKKFLRFLLQDEILCEDVTTIARNFSQREDVTTLTQSSSAPNLLALVEDVLRSSYSDGSMERWRKENKIRVPAVASQEEAPQASILDFMSSDLAALWPSEYERWREEIEPLLDSPDTAGQLALFSRKARYMHVETAPSAMAVAKIFDSAQGMLETLASAGKQIGQIRKDDPEHLNAVLYGEWEEIQDLVVDYTGGMHTDSFGYDVWYFVMAHYKLIVIALGISVGSLVAILVFLFLPTAVSAQIVMGFLAAITFAQLAGILPDQSSLDRKVQLFENCCLSSSYHKLLLMSASAFLAGPDSVAVESRMKLLQRVFLEANEHSSYSGLDAEHRWYVYQVILSESRKIEHLRTTPLPRWGSVVNEVQSGGTWRQIPFAYTWAVETLRKPQAEVHEDDVRMAKKFLRRQAAGGDPWAKALVKELGIGKPGDEAAVLMQIGLSREDALHLVERFSNISRLRREMTTHDMEMIYTMMEQDDDLVEAHPANGQHEIRCNFNTTPQGVTYFSAWVRARHKGVALVDPAKDEWPELEPFGFDPDDPDHVAMARKGFWMNPVNNTPLDRLQSPPESMKFKLITTPGRLDPVLENITDPEFQRDYKIVWEHGNAMGADVGIGYPPDVTRELTQAVNQKVDPARLNHVAGIDKDYPVRILESTRPDWLRLLPKSPTRLEILFDKDTNIRAVLAPGDKGLQDVTTNCPNELKTAMVKAARAAIRGQPESPLDNWTSPSEKYGASGMTLVEADALELPFAEGSLDFIWNFNVLQHYWSFEKGAIFEDFALRLKEGGIALVGMGGKEGPGPRLSWTVYRKTKGTLLPREIFFHPLAFLRTSDRVLNAWTRRFRKDILSGSMESNPETLVKRLRELGYPAEVRKGGMISLVLRPDGKAVNIRSLPLSTSLEWLDSTGSAA